MIITGASNGIGEGIAEAFANHGAVVCIADVDEKRGNEAQKKIEGSRGQAVFIKTDVRNEQDIIRLMKKVNGQYGKIDILINNAG